MKSKLIALFLLLLPTLITYTQNTEKIFYDKEWKGTSESNAWYYRIACFDESGNPAGEITDYYITGEIQSKAEGAIYIDRKNDENTIFTGKTTGYYKDGKIKFEQTRNPQGQILQSKSYNKKGDLTGESTYYPSGMLFRRFTYTNGQLRNNTFTECDENGTCEEIFLEDFSSPGINNWELNTAKNYTSKIIPGTGLVMQNKSDSLRKQTIYFPIDPEKDFSVETTVSFKKGEKMNGYGLLWGFKDWNNYAYFLINSQGYYKTGEVIKGIYIGSKAWKPVSNKYMSNQHNQLKITKLDEKLLFSVDGNAVHVADFSPFIGNYIGFMAQPGKSEVLFENLIIKQNTRPGIATSTSPKQEPDTERPWRGNGTGFFIDPRGYIATNYHVINKGSEFEVEFIRNEQKQIFRAEVIQGDENNDIAIIKIKEDTFQPFSKLPYNFQNETSDVGTNIFALGYPMALSVMGTEIKFTDGKISSKTGFRGDVVRYQISVPIQPGNSGGPLFDYDGNLIGITSSGLNRERYNIENVNYAIKAAYLKNLIDVIPAKINLPDDTSISGKTLVDKIKILSDYVVLIKVR